MGARGTLRRTPGAVKRVSGMLLAALLGVAAGWAAARAAPPFALFVSAPALGAAPAESAAAPSVPAEAEPGGSFTLLAVGDIQLSRRVAPVIAERGWAHPTAALAPLISGADLAFANLECPASYLGTPYPGKPPEVTFRARPGDLFALKAAGFDVLSLANNHAGDYGEDALRETLEALRLLDIAVCGAGMDEADARRPAVLSAADRKVAFLAYAEPIWSVLAAGEGPGVAVLREDAVVADLAAAREWADIVVLSLHWGEEHRGQPRESDRALARRLVDAGADAVIGHHPHVLQGAEFYRGAPILYSLGNFVFDMVSPATYDGAAALLEFRDGRAVRLSFLPISIDRKTYAPARAEGEAADRILSLIAARCLLVGSPGARREDGSFVLEPPGLNVPTAAD